MDKERNEISNIYKKANLNSSNSQKTNATKLRQFG